MIVLSNFICARSALRKKIGIFKAKLRKTNGKSSKKSDFELFQILANNKTPGQHLENFWSLIRPPEKHLADLSLRGGVLIVTPRYRKKTEAKISNPRNSDSEKSISGSRIA